MARPILSAYGPERSSPGNSGKNQGRTQRDVMNYLPPKGPKTPTDPKGVGLHGRNFDYCGTQEADSVRSQSSGSPGLGGENGCCPQGRH